MNRLHVIALALGAAAVGGCSSGYGTGAMLTVDYFGDTDVVGYAFKISESDHADCDITGQALDDEVFFVDLLDNVFPGRVDHVEEWLENDTRHLGADLFASLVPGCYDVTATPIHKVPASVSDYLDDAAEYVSKDCGAASAEGINVSGGETTEVLLASQCIGDAFGALDTTIIMNHPPTIKIGIDEKYAYECEKVEVCAEAWDVDDDPIDIDWARTDGTSTGIVITEGDLEVIDVVDGHRVWEQCVTIRTRYTDSYLFEATVYDLAEGGASRIEDKLADWGSEETESHGALEFPIHTNWVEYPKCYDDDGDLVDATDVEIDLDGTCTPTSDEDYYCDGLNSYGVDEDLRAHICKDDDGDGKYDTLVPENLYPDCPDK